MHNHWRLVWQIIRWYDSFMCCHMSCRLSSRQGLYGARISFAFAPKNRTGEIIYKHRGQVKIHLQPALNLLLQTSHVCQMQDNCDY